MKSVYKIKRFLRSFLTRQGRLESFVKLGQLLFGRDIALQAIDQLGVEAIKVPYLAHYNPVIDIKGGSITSHVLEHGHFQFEAMQEMAKHIDLSLHAFVNIGANIGTTCINAHALGARKFFAFEPVKANFELLTINLGQLKNCESLQCFQTGIGASQKSAIINLKANSSGRHSLVSDFGGKREQIDIQRLDHYNIPSGALLWIDTEGYELEVLKGAGEVLNFASGACIEISPHLMCEKQLAQLISILENQFTRFLTTDGISHVKVMEVEALRQGMPQDILCLP